MQHYFFHLWDGQRLRVDRCGVDVDHLDEALEEVARAAARLEGAGEDMSKYIVHVVNDDGSATTFAMKELQLS
jgi:hypothetical protein